MNNFDLSLYLVTDEVLLKGESMEQVIKDAVKGGVTMVQLREKNTPTSEFYKKACSLKKLLAPLGIPLIINDRLDIAIASDADGLHIGQSDMPYSVVRKILGKNKIIGLSVETVEQAREANNIDVDYIGLSPVFSTDTKTDINTPLELEGIKNITTFTKHKTVAIGGINTKNTSDIIKNGVNGIAVISAIIGKKNTESAAKELKEIIEKARI